MFNKNRKALLHAMLVSGCFPGQRDLPATDSLTISLSLYAITASSSQTRF